MNTLNIELHKDMKGLWGIQKINTTSLPRSGRNINK